MNECNGAIPHSPVTSIFQRSYESSPTQKPFLIQYHTKTGTRKQYHVPLYTIGAGYTCEFCSLDAEGLHVPCEKTDFLNLAESMGISMTRIGYWWDPFCNLKFQESSGGGCSLLQSCAFPCTKVITSYITWCLIAENIWLPLTISMLSTFLSWKL